MSPVHKGAEPKSWIQEIKSNRRLQVGLGSVPVLLWLLWPSSPSPARRPPSTARASQALDDRQARELQKLPNLAKLDRAGELPKEDRMYRDLFLFDGPPPPPPPTAEQLAAEALRLSRAQESGSRPQDLRYLGFLGTPSAGRLGAFMRGEEPVTLKPGELANPHWRLLKLTDVSAEFQNVKYADLRHKIDAVDLQGGAGGGRTQAPSNEY